MSQEHYHTVKYACKDDDEQFIHAPDTTCARRIRWIQCAVGRSPRKSKQILLEILAGNEEDVWLWVDGDEAALPEPWFTGELPYALTAEALQARQASQRFESQEMAEMRRRVQSASPLVRLAAIVWLVLTSKAMKKLDSEHGLMDREEWGLSGLIRDWWLGLYDVRNRLPGATTKKFEKAMGKEGHTCHIEFMAVHGPKLVRHWLCIQSVLFPERVGVPANLMDSDWDKCKACCSYVIRHYLQAQQFYVPSPYAVLPAIIFYHSSSLEDKGPSFLDWITALSSRHGQLQFIISNGHRLCETLQLELKYLRVGHFKFWDTVTRYAPWVNSYPKQWRFQLSQYSSETWKLADPIVRASLSTSEAIPDFATWLAAAIWTMCTHETSSTAAVFYQRLEYTITRLYLIRGLPTDIYPANTDVVENFRHKIKNSSHTCWDTSEHDPGWYASAVSYLNDNNDPEVVPYIDSDPSKAACEECRLLLYADQFIKVLSESFRPQPVGQHIGLQSTLSSAPTSGSVPNWLAFHIPRILRLQEPWKLLCKLNLSQWASEIMKIIQNELNANQHGEYGRTYMHLLRKMAQLYGVLPPSFLLSDLATEGKRPVCGGGFSDIWKGKLGNKNVCIKVLRVFTTASMREKLVKQFCREAILWGQFKHPNILPFLGVSFDLFDPSFCLVSPWMENGNILQFLERNPTYDRMIAIREVAEGLKYLHTFNPSVVHGDVRGANILVTSDLRCCLADFGLAAAVESQIFTTTSTNGDRGTIRWMAPEALAPGDKSSSMAPSRDIYAFACTMLELCTGQVPFHEIRGDGAVIYKVVHCGERPKRPSSDIWFPDELWDLVEMCWREDPTTRPTAAKVVELIGSIEKSLNKK